MFTSGKTIFNYNTILNSYVRELGTCFIRILQHMLFDHKQFVWTQRGHVVTYLCTIVMRFVQMQHAHECIGHMTYTYNTPYNYLYSTSYVY